MLENGDTVPFISRYRKELHGDMDVRTFSERYEYMKNLEARKDTVIAAIEEQGKLTDELKKKIEDAELLTNVEDLYLPYKQKKKTRASVYGISFMTMNTAAVPAEITRQEAAGSAFITDHRGVKELPMHDSWFIHRTISF